MPGHIPDLSAKSLARLRAFVRDAQAKKGKGVPLAKLTSLNRDLNFESGLTIDFDASEDLGAPLVVLRAPTKKEHEVRLDNLTKRENEVAGLIATGLTNAEIADKLCISISTVKDHVHNILEKTGLRRRTRIAAAVNGRSE